MVRTNQGGSVLSFIVVGIVAVLLLIGGAYAVRQQSNTQPELTQPRGTTTPPQETNKPSPSDTHDKNKATESEKKNEKQSNETEQQSAPAQPMPVSGLGDGGELPQTGPRETLGALIVIGLLIATALSYLRSRRPELSL